MLYRACRLRHVRLALTTTTIPMMAAPIHAARGTGATVCLCAIPENTGFGSLSEVVAAAVVAVNVSPAARITAMRAHLHSADPGGRTVRMNPLTGPTLISPRLSPRPLRHDMHAPSWRPECAPVRTAAMVQSPLSRDAARDARASATGGGIFSG